ncbi:uncharacterized protein LOC141665258 [Apium graveolens]|uniref:uncharacterized protein LOC141665258 n=1 Tax=Apium graveolens TaxID=4045 RepID=UPI003D79FAB7
MCNVVLKYFREVYAGSEDKSNELVDNGERVIIDDHNRELTTEINFMEITIAIKQMHLDKSAGPDGFSPAFFQHFWNLLGEEVFKCSFLGKHIWDFCQKSESLVTRIFKARYFPGRHILQAVKGNDSSFIWSGIWEANEKLKGGFRWVLGDVKELSIFKDPWLQGKVDFRVEDSHLNIIRNEKHVMGVDIKLQDIEDASIWLLDLISKGSSDMAQAAAIVLSSIWFAKNKKVWEDKTINPAVTVDICRRQVHDWNQVSWKPPEEGYLKLNVDAGLTKGENMFTVGMTIRDDKGHFVTGKNMKIVGQVSVLEAEARGVREAINLVNNIGLQHVVIESDAQVVVQALKSKESYQVEVGHIIDECKEMLGNRADLSIIHIKNQANMGAHWMARVPCLLDHSNIFMYPPVCGDGIY